MRRLDIHRTHEQRPDDVADRLRKMEEALEGIASVKWTSDGLEIEVERRPLRGLRVRVTRSPGELRVQSKLPLLLLPLRGKIVALVGRVLDYLTGIGPEPWLPSAP